MGATQSTSGTEKVYHNETPIQFSQEVVDHLSEHAASSTTPFERQTVLDAHIRSRIQGELTHLREEEENVRKEIEQALERENLDHEKTMAGQIEEEGHGDVKSSVALMGDLEEIRSKIDKFEAKRHLDDFPSVKDKGDAVVLCYRLNSTTPLDCWREVKEFKQSVSTVEAQYFKSLR